MSAARALTALSRTLWCGLALSVGGFAQETPVARLSPAEAQPMRALTLGLKTRNKEILGPGVANKDKAMEALVIVNRLLADDTASLLESRSVEALDALGKLVSEQFLLGGAPLGPREWGMFLEFVVWKAKQTAKS